jgi:hypothetical protein
MRESQTVIPVARHEASDISDRFIWGALALMLATLILCALIVFWLYPQTLRHFALHLPSYPAPRLQANPQAELRAFRAQQLARLNSTGWVDQAHGVVHIPISAAMRKLADEGITDWPDAPAQAP